MANQEISSISFRKFVLDTIKKQKPETTKELIKIIQKKYPICEIDLIGLLSQLEAENKIVYYKNKVQHPIQTLGDYLFSIKAIWYWSTIIVSTLTIITLFTIPENAYPLVYLRQILGAFFILFLPGFVIIKSLYPTEVPLATSSENLDTVERIALSFGLSITIVAITGLVFNYTPWGIRLVPITLGLFLITIVSATVAVLREFQTKKLKE